MIRRHFASILVLLFSAACGGAIVHDGAAIGAADGAAVGTPTDAAAAAAGDSGAVNMSDAPLASTDASSGCVDAAVDAPSRAGWRLVWSEEFSCPTIDQSIWRIANERGNSANMELQYYTPRKNAEPSANVFIENGALVLEAREDIYSGYAYTSGKVTTQGTKEFTYGRFEASMKLPAVSGMWPAFWMLGTNIQSVGWPACGEIDIMEGKGRIPNWISGALHRGPSKPLEVVSVAPYQLASGNYHDTWHVFALEWDATQIRWYVDDVLFQSVNRPTLVTVPWPFDQPFFFIFNLAVGGVFDLNVVPPPGMPPQRVYVDYLRVFQK